MLNHLKNILTKAYGFFNKNVPISIRRDDGCIENYTTTHDGKTIVSSFASANPECLKTLMVKRKVDAFEKQCGDGTSFFSLLLLNLILLDKKISKKELDNVLFLLDNDTAQNKHREWVTTVLNNDALSEDIYNILQKTCVHRIEKNTSCALHDSVSVLQEHGYSFSTNIEPAFLHPQYKNNQNVTLFIDKRKINMHIYNDYVNIALRTHRKIFLLVDYYELEVADYINTSHSQHVILLQTPLHKKYILDDIIMISDAQKEEEEQFYITKCDISIFNNKVTVLPKNSIPIQDLETYVKTLHPLSKKQEDIITHNIRIDSILKQQVSTIKIEATSRERLENIYFMIEDAIHSQKHTSSGYVKGYMQWFNKTPSSCLEIALYNIKELFSTSNRDLPTCFYKNAYDAKDVIKNAIISAVTFNNELLNIDFKNEIKVNAINQ